MGEGRAESSLPWAKIEFSITSYDDASARTEMPIQLYGKGARMCNHL